MKFRAPQFPNLSVMLADSNVFTLKLLTDMCRECGMHKVTEVKSSTDLPVAVAANAIDIFVIDQRMLEDTEASGWSLIDARIGADGVAPVILLLGLPTARHVGKARHHGIRIGLSKPFSRKDFWSRMSWLASRAAPSEALAIAHKRLGQPMADAPTVTL